VAHQLDLVWPYLCPWNSSHRETPFDPLSVAIYAIAFGPINTEAATRRDLTTKMGASNPNVDIA
jgi:hypothetical protein